MVFPRSVSPVGGVCSSLCEGFRKKISPAIRNATGMPRRMKYFFIGLPFDCRKLERMFAMIRYSYQSRKRTVDMLGIDLEKETLELIKRSECFRHTSEDPAGDVV